MQAVAVSQGSFEDISFGESSFEDLHFEPFRTVPDTTHDEISVGLSHPNTATLSRKPVQCGASACTPSSATCDQGNLLACGIGGSRSGAKRQRPLGVAQGCGPDTKGRKTSNKPCAHDIDECLLSRSPRCLSHVVPGSAVPFVGTDPRLEGPVRNGAEVCTPQRYYSNGWSSSVGRGTSSPAAILASPTRIDKRRDGDSGFSVSFCS